MNKLLNKNKAKRALCLILVALMLTLALFSVSCSRDTAAIMSYRGAEIDSEMYTFWFSYYKMQLMSAYGISGKNDTEAFWQSEISDGVTYGDYFTSVIDDRIKAKAVTTYMYDSLADSLPDYGIDEVEQYMLDMIDYVGYGDEAELEKVAAKYYTSADAIKRSAECDYKAELLFTLLYGDGGKLTDAQKDSYYNDAYSRVKVIFINTYTKTVTEEDKSYVNGLTQAEREAKLLLADEIEAALAIDSSEAAFEALMSHSDDTATSHYENGFYLSKLSDYPISEVLQGALALEVGEYTRVESEYGIHFILRYPLDEKGYETKENSDWFGDFNINAAMWNFDNAILGMLDDVTVNEEIKAEYPIYKIKYNYEINPIIKD